MKSPVEQATKDVNVAFDNYCEGLINEVDFLAILSSTTRKLENSIEEDLLQQKDRCVAKLKDLENYKREK